MAARNTPPGLFLLPLQFGVLGVSVTPSAPPPSVMLPAAGTQIIPGETGTIIVEPPPGPTAPTTGQIWPR